VRKLFNRFSIKTKLSLLVLTSCTVLLVVISSVLLVSEFYARQVALKQNIRILATSLTEQLWRPLLLEKYADAETLLGSLNRQRNIQAAYLFDRTGIPVAEYLSYDRSRITIPALERDFAQTGQGQPGALPVVQEKLYLKAHYFSSFTPVDYEGRQIGTLYLVSDLDSFYAGLGTIIGGVGCAFVLLGCFSWILAGLLQKPVSDPLLRLATLMKQISREKDYSVRAFATSQDEIGALVKGFNDMLAQIERHQRQLNHHRKNLEKTVATRTAELQSALGELEIARNQADAANAAKSDFLSRMTHELRTPLIGVLGMNELLTRTSLTEQQKMLVDTVQSSGEELLRLISDVLDFSRIEAGKMNLQPVPAELFRIIESIVELLAPQAREKNITLACQIPLDSTWRVKVDEVRMRQILMNLIGNALKFTRQGSVMVTLSCTELSGGEGNFVIEVEDTGCGMDEAASRQIFDVFYQAENSDTRANSGAGLGLAIVRQLVDLMAGRIEFSSAPGKGTLFRVTVQLPLLEKIDFRLPDEAIATPLLLCAEPRADFNILRSYLEQLGCRPVVAENAADALYQLGSARRRGEPYQLLLVGQMVCLLDGRPLFQALREDEYSHDLRRIVRWDDHSQVVPMLSGETRLSGPLTWSGLVDAIRQSHHQLHLVADKKQPGATAGQVMTASASRIMLVSSNIPSRELLRLQLSRAGFAVDVAGNVNLLGELQSYVMVIYDLPHLNEGDLLQFWDGLKEPRPLTVVLAEKSLPPAISSHIDECLLKPFTMASLERILAPLQKAAIRETTEKGAVDESQ